MVPIVRVFFRECYAIHELASIIFEDENILRYYRQLAFHLQSNDSFMDTITLSNITLKTLIGIHAWEQSVPQKLVLDLTLTTDAALIAQSDSIDHAIDYEKVVQEILSFANKQHFQLVETFADRLANHLLTHFQTDSVTLTVHKPGALKEAKDVAIRVTRNR